MSGFYCGPIKICLIPRSSVTQCLAENLGRIPLVIISCRLNTSVRILVTSSRLIIWENTATTSNTADASVLNRDVVKRHSKMKTHTSSKLIWIAGFVVPTAEVMKHSISSCSLFRTCRLQLQRPKHNRSKKKKNNPEAGRKNY
jgi:hypothetical protein